MTTETTITLDALHHFTGTETWFRHPLVRKVLYTEGVQYLAETGGAYWLLDEIACAQIGEATVAAAPFQFWKLTVRPNSTGHLRCDDGNGRVVCEKALEFTDFPLPEIALYFTDNVILLPSAY